VIFLWISINVSWNSIYNGIHLWIPRGATSTIHDNIPCYWWYFDRLWNIGVLFGIQVRE